MDKSRFPTFGDMCNGPIGNGGKRARPSARLIIRFLQRDATSNRHDQSQRHVEQTGILQKVERLQLSTRVYSSASVSGVRQNSLVGVMIFCGFCGFWDFRAFGGKMLQVVSSSESSSRNAVFDQEKDLSKQLHYFLFLVGQEAKFRLIQYRRWLHFETAQHGSWVVARSQQLITVFVFLIFIVTIS